MPSAAANVSAVPELLEAILLNLYWRDLFRILRTNSIFYNTITASLKLRQRMHREYKLPSEDSGIPSNSELCRCSVFHDLYLSGDLDLGPFIISHCFGPSQQIFVHLQESTYKPVGFAKRLRLREDAAHGSWRKLKLTHRRGAVRIAIRVDKKWAPGYWQKDLEFGSGEGNLGEVIDALVLVRDSTLNRHKDR